MRNLFFKILTLVLAFNLSLGVFVACDDTVENPEHVHKFSTKYFYDNSTHYYKCDCGEKSGVNEHEIFGNACACGYKLFSENLSYELVTIDGVEGFCVSGIGSCQDNDVIIPSTYQGEPVISIGAYAFDSCRTLESVVIPDSVILIGDHAFGSCVNLAKLKMGNGVKIIDRYAFASCKSLPNFNIPSSVTSIGYWAFYWCNNLKEIIVPSSVTFVDEWAFYGCFSATIYCEAEVMPSGWHKKFNPNNVKVVWNYKKNHN